MMKHFDDVRAGFDIDADVVVVGTGASGAVAAANFAAAGMRTVVLEAGPLIRPEDMTRDAPRFLARYFWEGGLRIGLGTAPVPSMQGRCVGGSTVSNSAIMLKLPDWVREEWRREDNIQWLADGSLDAAFERVFERTKTAPTPMVAMGRRNFFARDVLSDMGVPSKPLPRAVSGCDGCADCLVGCHDGRKQSVDRSYVPQAMIDGAEVYTCCHVCTVDMDGDRVTGVRGDIVEPRSREHVAKFRVRAPVVVLAAGVMSTPVILKHSRINPRGRVGATLNAHVSAGVFAVLDEQVDPWVGASQGWGAISTETRGLKYESLWADPSVMLVRWGGIGRHLLERLQDIRNMALVVMVYRGGITGKVGVGRDLRPRIKFHIPDDDARLMYRECHRVITSMQTLGARYAHVGNMPGVPEDIYTAEDAEGLLSNRLKGKHLTMTGNHVFGSCRMSSDPQRGPVDPDGRVHGTQGLYVVDTSIFPSPSAVNPQATCMALADVLTRRISDLGLAG